MDTCTQRRGDRAISPYDYIRCGETSKKVVTVKFEGSKRERMGIRSVFLWGPGIPVMNKKITIWVLLGEKLDVVGCCRGKLSARRRRASS